LCFFVIELCDLHLYHYSHSQREDSEFGFELRPVHKAELEEECLLLPWLGYVQKSIISTSSTDWTTNLFEIYRVEDVMPADWAFTVFSLFSLVHPYLIDNGKIELDKKILDHIIKSYDSSLRGVKCVAFMASIFACVHYDFYQQYVSSEGNTYGCLDRIREIGRTVTNYDESNGGWKNENRIYLTFVRLFLADIYKENDDEETCEEILEEIKFDDRIYETGLHSLWIFLLLCSELIKEDKRQNAGEYPRLHNLEISQFVMSPDCTVRWRKAFVNNRLYDSRPEFYSSVGKWLGRLGDVSKEKV